MAPLGLVRAVKPERSHTEAETAAERDYERISVFSRVGNGPGSASAGSGEAAEQ